MALFRGSVVSVGLYKVPSGWPNPFQKKRLLAHVEAHHEQPWIRVQNTAPLQNAGFYSVWLSRLD